MRQQLMQHASENTAKWHMAHVTASAPLQRLPHTVDSRSFALAARTGLQTLRLLLTVWDNSQIVAKGVHQQSEGHQSAAYAKAHFLDMESA
jgi:hypothetical protein